MIPSIETICDDLAAGKITTSQAVTWLHQHAAGAVDELRDYFAAKAMQGLLAGCAGANPQVGTIVHMMAYQIADAMLKARTA